MNLETKKYLAIFAKKGTLLSVVEIASKGLSILLLPVFVKYLTPSEYGTAALTLNIASLLGLIYNPGMLSATTRMYHDATNQEERRTLIGSAFVFNLGFPLIVSIVVLIFGNRLFNAFFSELSFYPYGVLAVFFAYATQPKRLWLALMSLTLDTRSVAIVSISALLIGTSLSLLFVVKFEWGALGKLLGALIGAFLLLIIAIHRIYKYSGHSWTWSSMRGQLKVGFPVIIAIWSYEVLNISDRFMLEAYGNLTEVGLYSFAYTLAQVPLFLAVGIKQLWSPIFYNGMNNNEYLTIAELIKYYFASVFVVCGALLILSDVFIPMLVSTAYLGSLQSLGVILVGVCFNILLILPNSFHGYAKKFSITSKNALFSAILNLILNYFLIPKFGALGAGIATLLSYFIYMMLAIYAINLNIFRIYLMKLSLAFLLFSALLVLSRDIDSYYIISLSMKITVQVILVIIGAFTLWRVSL